MTVGELIFQLQQILKEPGVTEQSPVILEGLDEDDHTVQACIDGVSTEARCEDDDEPQGVYLDLSELEIS